MLSLALRPSFSNFLESRVPLCILLTSVTLTSTLSLVLMNSEAAALTGDLK